ncbi:hypothetical protein FLCU109888_09370 [Flavobacterium cucumis]|uniref:Uncharacterized membrane protein n=1 Tax=Flavobacterium cucumis TaxID=416016 RepID=A0A1M7ZXE6_9FLAO|nr:hypothetical protein [Flavobacterium cucumis]SHO73490.1 Uncharacterized membrane protein [Flavobacterium cucumis]
MKEIEQGKQIAWISYITIVGTIIAIFMNNETKNSFASFHIRQALGIFLTFFLLGYPIGYFDSWMVSASFWTFIFILWLFGFMNALNGEQKPVPFLGEFYQNVFKSF